MKNNHIHTPVLRDKTCEYLQASYKTIVDGTLGHGGHTYAMIQYMQNNFHTSVDLIGIDADQQMLEVAKAQTQEYASQVSYVHDSYAHIQNIMQSTQKKADFILLDIGVNWEHFANGSRGFSIKYSGPLDMRFNTQQKQTAQDIIMHYSSQKLQDLFIRYGDARPGNAQRIADAIVEARKTTVFQTTDDLMKLFRELRLPIKFVAVLFQCLRIEVNNELGQLQTFLQDFPEVMNTGGRCAIMSYHSIEDRYVKYAFKALEET